MLVRVLCQGASQTSKPIAQTPWGILLLLGLSPGSLVIYSLQGEQRCLQGLVFSLSSIPTNHCMAGVGQELVPAPVCASRQPGRTTTLSQQNGKEHIHGLAEQCRRDPGTSGTGKGWPYLLPSPTFTACYSHCTNQTEGSLASALCLQRCFPDQLFSMKRLPCLQTRRLPGT